MNKEKRLDMVLDALANKTRRSIIHTLALKPATISQLARQEKVSLPAMHKHLALLSNAELIRRQKVGRVNFIALNPDSLQIVKSWVNRYQPHWGSRKVTLENYISKYLDSNPPTGG